MTEETGRRDYRFTTLESAITAAWSNYKMHHDPPGCEGSEARAKAWAWYDAQAPQRALTAGEQLVWAAAFSAALARGLSCPLSVRLAMSAVYTLREAVIDGDSELDRDQRAAVEQMRGGQ